MHTDFQLGDYTVRPQLGRLERDGEVTRLTPKAIGVLMCLADAKGSVVSRNDLLDTVWPSMVVSDDVLTQNIVELRKAFGDAARNPKYIETIPKVGFRLIPAVAPTQPHSADIETSVEPMLEPASPAPVVKRFYQYKMFHIAIGCLLVFWVLWGIMHSMFPPNPEPQQENLSGNQVFEVDQIRSVGVLPFENISEDPANEYFSDGLSEELITRLSRIQALHVPSRNSTFAFREEVTDPRLVGERLNVDSVLEGSVRKSGDRLRITARLVTVNNGYQVWSEIYDRQQDDIFAIQADIARAIVDAVAIEISDEDVAKVVEPQTLSVEAYDLFTLGTYHLRRDIRRGKEYFERAIEIDPEFAAAHAMLSLVHFAEMQYFGIHGGEAMDKAEHAIVRALELDPELALAYVIRANLNALTKDWSDNETDTRRAIELNPNLVEAYVGLTSSLWYQGQIREALVWAERAMELDVLHANYFWPITEAYAQRGRGDEVATLFSAAVEAGYRSELLAQVLVRQSAYFGKFDEGVAWARRLADKYPGPGVSASVGQAYTYLGDFKEAKHWISQAVEVAPRRAVRERARLLLASGQYAPALKVLSEELTALEASGLGETRLIEAIEELTGVINAWSGDYSAAVRHLKVRYDWMDSWATTDPSWAALLAFSLRQLGDLEGSATVITRVQQILENAQAQGLSEFPRMIMGQARLHAVAGEREQALAELEQAIKAGWRDYYFEIGSPIWQEYESNETYRRLMAEVKADVERMLTLVRENYDRQDTDNDQNDIH